MKLVKLGPLGQNIWHKAIKEKGVTVDDSRIRIRSSRISKSTNLKLGK